MAFRTHEEHYEFLIMLFGLANSLLPSGIVLPCATSRLQSAKDFSSLEPYIDVGKHKLQAKQCLLILAGDIEKCQMLFKIFDYTREPII